jgi:hypothetical protein
MDMGCSLDWPLVLQATKIVLDPIAQSSWPISILAGLWIFRGGLKGLISRVHTVRGAGVEVIVNAVENQQAKALTTEERAQATIGNIGDGYPGNDEILDRMDEHFRSMLDQNVGDDIQKKLAWAIRLRSASEANRIHETNYRLMFGSQLKVLRDLNVQIRARLRSFEPLFLSAKSDPITSPFHADRSFEQWMQFLIDIGYVQYVITSVPEEIELTPFGRNFLVWMASWRASEFRPG